MPEESGELYTHALLLNNRPVAKFHSEGHALLEQKRMSAITESLHLTNKQKWTVAKIADNKTIEDKGSEKQKREARRRALIEQEVAKSREQLRSRYKKR